MAFYPHYLLQWGGTLGTAGEIWSNSLRFASVADLDPGIDPENELTAKVNKVRSLIQNPQACISNAVTLTYVKLNAVGPDGRYVSNTESHTRYLEGEMQATGPLTSNYLPYQCTAVVSLRTAYARGRGSRGRLFSPGTSSTITKEGKMSTGQGALIAQAYAAFIEGLNTWQGPLSGLRANVLSSINGAHNPITRVEVGDVIDTMRSRRNALTEVRAGTNVTP